MLSNSLPCDPKTPRNFSSTNSPGVMPLQHIDSLVSTADADAHAGIKLNALFS
ncbi:hypothetical protein HK100_004255 [Physocladia obscura]|uniref:Uncharacterized protein n=1 Tax=Physocladia obscura TaxID=109957 RepID=A0AAD5XA02_9FUNG|nr:hypothetical protein HK100_004255 [Physocladia obscura]